MTRTSLAFLIAAMLLIQLCVNSQTKTITKLSQAIYQATSKEKRLEAILILCEEYKSLHRDTLDYYANEALRMTEKSNDVRSKSLARLAYANSYFRWGWMDSALIILEPALKDNPVDKPATRDLYFKIARQKALYYGGKSELKEALRLLYEIVAQGEKYNDSIVVATNMNTVASVALSRGQSKEALQWLWNAKRFTDEGEKLAVPLSAIYTNLADAYNQQIKLDSAEYYIEKGIALFRKQENLGNLAIALQKQSDIYVKHKRYAEAEAALKEMIEVRQQTNDGSMYVDENLSLINFYLETNQTDKAIATCLDKLQRGNLYETVYGPSKNYSNNINLRLQYYEALARAYKIKGEKGLYSETLEKIITAKDSFYEANAAEAIAELQTKYDVQKKENTIIQQELDITTKNFQFYALCIVLIFLAILSFILFKNYRKRQQMKLAQTIEEEKRMAAQAVTEAEENERRRISADLHDNLGVQANAILYGTELLQQQQSLPEVPLVNDLHNTAKNMLTTLRETLWAMKSTDTTIAEVWLRIINFSKQLARYYPGMQISAAGTAPGAERINAARALNVILIVQEAVNNAVRHSGATLLQIESNPKNEGWQLIIRDNGRGFNKAVASNKKDSYGLGNMQERAKTADLLLTIETAPDKGVAIIIEIKQEIDPNGLLPANMN